MSILILGSSGQVGAALLRVCRQQNEKAIGLSRQEADLSNSQILRQALDQLSATVAPSAVINAAAYTQVDLAEKEEELAYRINAEAPKALAQWCAEKRIPFIHYSTDYVFSGQGHTPWKEEDKVQPQNAYGRTKLDGERFVSDAGGKWLIFRTSWVYDSTGKNFVRTMLRLGAERESLKVVADQHGAPSFATHLAEATIAALKNAQKMPEFPSGIYHFCNSGETNWHEFAQAIFAMAREQGMKLQIKSVDPIASSDYPTPAKRPLNSRLNTSKLKNILGVQLPHWRDGLSQCLSEMTTKKE
jgi:dTDP-4-dehydrorhamnose reductase